jgi:hypothetical protein
MGGPSDIRRGDVSELVTLAELTAYLGDAPAADETVLERLLEDVEALFEAATLRPAGSYAAAATARTEVLDGTGSARLYLAYPIVAVTSIKLGYDPATPDETLDPTNKLVVVFGVGSRVITRTDGGKFGTVRQARFVQVVYDHAGDLPENAKLAIKSVAATAYRRRGSEEAQSETIGGFYDRTMLENVAVNDPFWPTAVAANTPVVLA